MRLGVLGRLAAIGMVVCCVMPAHAAGKKGAVTMPQNVLTVNGETIQLKHFRALLHDNAEGLLDLHKELRILITDREVPADALDGLTMLPVLQLAKDDKVQGLLIKLDPSDLGVAYVTLLRKPVAPQISLMTQTVSSSNTEVVGNFNMGNGSVSGVMEHHEKGDSFFADMPTMSYAVSFRMPLDHVSVITSDLKGNAAQKSPQAAILAKKGEALMKKDFALLRTLQTEAAYRRGEMLLSNPAFQEVLPEMGAEIKKSVGHISRLIVRGKRAVIVFDDHSWNEFVDESGEWKSEN